MQRARRFRDRFSSWTCVLTDEASTASLSATGTPLTSLIGMDEGRDSSDAAKEVFQAREVNKHARIRDAAIDGEGTTTNSSNPTNTEDKKTGGSSTPTTTPANQ